MTATTTRIPALQRISQRHQTMKKILFAFYTAFGICLLVLAFSILPQ